MPARSSKVTEPETSSLSNPAVARCAEAWDRTYHLASIDPEDDSLEPSHNNSDFFACQQADIAFRNAMPPLCGYQNIQNFIACVAYARLRKIIYPDDAGELLFAAQVALSAIRAQRGQPKA